MDTNTTGSYSYTNTDGGTNIVGWSTTSLIEASFTATKELAEKVPGNVVLEGISDTRTMEGKGNIMIIVLKTECKKTV